MSSIPAQTGYSLPSAAAAAPPVYDAAFTAIDLTDGTWTLVDPDSLVNSITHAAGFNTLTWNALALGSQDMVPINSGNFRGPRWYKLLVLDTTQVVSDDLVMFQSRLENDETVDDFNQAVVMGTCIDPTATVLNTIRGVGGIYSANASSNPAYGAWSVSSATTSAGATNHHGIIATIFGSLFACGSTYVTLNAAGARVNNGSRNASGIIASGLNVHIMVGFGTRANSDTITAGDKSSLKFGYIATTVVNT